MLAEAAYIGTEADGAELLRPLRELEPQIDTFAMVQPPALAGLHMDPLDPIPATVDGGLLTSLPAEALDGLAEVAGAESGTPLLSVELRHLGGALAEPSPDHGAVGAIEASFAYLALGLAMNPEMAAAVRADVEHVVHLLEPYDPGRTYFNFTERTVESSALFPPETVRRLRGIKRELDPEDLFFACHPVAPA